MSQHSFRRADGTGCRRGELPAWLSCRHGHTSGTRGPETPPPTPGDARRPWSEGGNGPRPAGGGAAEEAGPGRGLPQENGGLGISGDKYLMP